LSIVFVSENLMLQAEILQIERPGGSGFAPGRNRQSREGVAHRS
jgi:hypothetical protein